MPADLPPADEAVAAQQAEAVSRALAKNFARAYVAEVQA